jgi:hypothetical protein
MHSVKSNLLSNKKESQNPYKNCGFPALNHSFLLVGTSTAYGFQRLRTSGYVEVVWIQLKRQTTYKHFFDGITGWTGWESCKSEFCFIQGRAIS